MILIKKRLAQNFFLKMTSTQPSDRYTADLALKHPWISRNELDLIPFSFAEEQAAFNRAQYLILVRIN